MSEERRVRKRLKVTQRGGGGLALTAKKGVEYEDRGMRGTSAEKIMKPPPWKELP